MEASGLIGRGGGNDDNKGDVDDAIHEAGWIEDMVSVALHDGNVNGNNQRSQSMVTLLLACDVVPNVAIVNDGTMGVMSRGFGGGGRSGMKASIVG
jgi:hypothetical protein